MELAPHLRKAMRRSTVEVTRVVNSIGVTLFGKKKSQKTGLPQARDRPTVNILDGNVKFFLYLGHVFVGRVALSVYQNTIFG